MVPFYRTFKEQLPYKKYMHLNWHDVLYAAFYAVMFGSAFYAIHTSLVIPLTIKNVSSEALDTINYMYINGKNNE
jgi:hypothetical protein